LITGVNRQEVVAQRYRRLRRRLRDNTGRVIRFTVDDDVITRRLVLQVEEPETEISVESIIGRVLVSAKPGERMVVDAPGGAVIVKVLETVDVIAL